MHNNCQQYPKESRIGTNHMPSPFDCSKREPFRTPCPPRPLPIYNPISQLLLHELLLPTPLQCQRPPLIPYPVAYPIVISHIYEHADASFQECRDVVGAGMERILAVPER